MGSAMPLAGDDVAFPDDGSSGVIRRPHAHVSSRTRTADVVLARRASHRTNSSRHPFGADDWAALHSASVADVSRDGSAILYAASVGGPKGTSTIEWRTISPTGSEPRLLKLPEHFTPAGFTHDGALYRLF